MFSVFYARKFISLCHFIIHYYSVQLNVMQCSKGCLAFASNIISRVIFCSRLADRTLPTLGLLSAIILNMRNASKSRWVQNMMSLQLFRCGSPQKVGQLVSCDVYQACLAYLPKPLTSMPSNTLSNKCSSQSDLRKLYLHIHMRHKNCW